MTVHLVVAQNEHRGLHSAFSSGQPPSFILTQLTLGPCEGDYRLPIRG